MTTPNSSIQKLFMLTRFIFSLLCILAAGMASAAPRNTAMPQDLTYQNEDTAQNDEGEGEGEDEADLAVPPPVMRTAPAVIMTGPMGNSPLATPPVQRAPAYDAPVYNPPSYSSGVQAMPMPAPVVIAPPSREPVVEQNQLAAPVLTYYGILDERSGSLPMDAWKSLTYAEAVGALTSASQRVSSGNGNGVLNELLRAAALSRTYEPSGTPELAISFFNARIMAAQATGDRDGALALLRTQPGTFKLQDWQSFIENEVRQRRFADVCAISSDKLAQDTSAFAQKMSILCDIKGGKNDTARLHLDLLREANDGDTLFLELAERALNPNVTPKSKQPLKLENLSTLHVAALSLGRPKLKPEQIDRLMSPAQPLLLDVAMSDAQRLKYAEQFARSNQISAQDYQGILASVKFPPKSIEQFRANPASLLTVPEKEWPASLRRAAALRAIHDEDNAGQKAHIITAAMAGLSNADLLGPLGDSLLAETHGMTALPDNVAAAPAMARLLLLRGNGEAANWWRLASAAPANRDALLPLFPLALLRGVLSDDDRNVWFERYGRTQLFSVEKKNFNLAMVKILGVMLPSNEDSQLAAQNVFPATGPNDKRMDVLLNNVAQGTSDAVLRALLALKAMRQNALAEKLALYNL